MDLRQLECFIAVAEALSFRKAADRLHVTQSSVSRQIQQLEHELGAALLIRDRQHVRLTDNGHSVLLKAKALLQDAAALVAAVNRASKPAAVRLNVGVGIPLAKSIQPLVTEYARQFPHVDVQYKDIIFARIQNGALRRGEIDVGIFWPPIDHAHMESERLFDESFRVIVPKSSPLARRKKLRLQELADQTLLLPEQTASSNTRVLQLARETGVSFKVAHTNALPHEAGAALVASGKGIYILAGDPLKFPSFGSAVAAIRLDEPISLQVHMAWRKGESSPAVLSFLDLARKLLQRAPSKPR
jgi:DNA-binding transcriptional LysR family regulator